jgi:hypothetical protein
LRLLKWVPIVDRLLKGGILLSLMVLGSMFDWNGALFLFALITLIIPLERGLSIKVFLWHYAFDAFRFLCIWSIRLILFPLLWTPFAIIAAEQGQFANPIWWPFLTLLPALYIVFDFNRTLKLFNRTLRLIALDFYKKRFLLLLLIGTMVLILHYRSVILHYRSIIILAYFMAIAVLFTYLIYNFVVTTRILLSDKTKFRHWLKTSITQVTAEELLHLLSLYQSTEYSRRLVVTIRERNALIASETSENLINELSLKLDSEIRSKPLTSDFAASEFFRSWMEKYTHNDNLRLKNLGTEFLDEIYITLEQIRSKRKGTDADLRNAHNRPAVSSSTVCGR